MVYLERATFKTHLDTVMVKFRWNRIIKIWYCLSHAICLSKLINISFPQCNVYMVGQGHTFGCLSQSARNYSYIIECLQCMHTFFLINVVCNTYQGWKKCCLFMIADLYLLNLDVDWWEETLGDKSIELLAVWT